MKILVVSQYYPPEPALIPADLVHHLRGQGHQVRVLTGYPNYPSGKIYPGYRQRWRARFDADGVEVLRVPLFIDHSLSSLRRIANYLTFGFSSASARRFARGADVIYVYATQLTAATGPWLWRITGGAPYVLHIQDLWPESILASSLSRKVGGVITTLLTPWIQSVYRNATHTIAIAPTMAGLLAQRGCRNVSLLYNWAEDAPTTLHPRTSRKQSLVTSIVYAGNLGDMQDLATAIRAAWVASDAGVQLRIVGQGVEVARLRQLIDELHATNVTLEPAVSRDAISKVYAESDFGFVTLRDEPLFRATIPSKFQALLGHALPVISTVQGDLRILTEELRVGLTADAESVDSLAAAFRRAAQMSTEERHLLSQNAARAAAEVFSRQQTLQRLTGILRQAAQGRPNDSFV